MELILKHAIKYKFEFTMQKESSIECDSWQKMSKLSTKEQ